MENEIQVIQNEIPVYEQAQRAEIDMQIATAKRFPRNVKRALENSIVIVTMTEDMAKSCGYTLPRAGKNISGPSVHLARVLAQNWGNLRVSAKGTMISDKYVTSEAVAIDLETNYAARIEARRKIIDKEGKRYNDDLINLTVLVTTAIAYRNAIFSVIPKDIVNATYQAAKDKLTGDLSDETKLNNTRIKVLKKFKETYDISEQEILKALGLNNINQIKQDEIASLIGLGQALYDGDTTIEDAFNREPENPDGEKVKEKADKFQDENETDVKNNNQKKTSDEATKDGLKMESPK